MSSSGDRLTTELEPRSSAKNIAQLRDSGRKAIIQAILSRQEYWIYVQGVVAPTAPILILLLYACRRYNEGVFLDLLRDSFSWSVFLANLLIGFFTSLIVLQLRGGRTSFTLPEFERCITGAFIVTLLTTNLALAACFLLLFFGAVYQWPYFVIGTFSAGILVFVQALFVGLYGFKFAVPLLVIVLLQLVGQGADLFERHAILAAGLAALYVAATAILLLQRNTARLAHGRWSSDWDGGRFFIEQAWSSDKTVDRFATWAASKARTPIIKLFWGMVMETCARRREQLRFVILFLGAFVLEQALEVQSSYNYEHPNYARTPLVIFLLVVLMPLFSPFTYCQHSVLTARRDRMVATMLYSIVVQAWIGAIAAVWFVAKVNLLVYRGIVPAPGIDAWAHLLMSVSSGAAGYWAMYLIGRSDPRGPHWFVQLLFVGFLAGALILVPFRAAVQSSFTLLSFLYYAGAVVILNLMNYKALRRRFLMQDLPVNASAFDLNFEACREVDFLAERR